MMKANIFFTSLVLSALLVQGQEPVEATLTRDLEQYRSQRLQEKIFLHTDKECYLAGEICWFKLYVAEAVSHHPLDLSKVAYLEWLDKDNKPVLQVKIGLSKGHGNGSLYLPLTLRSGNYKLRAYTSWMKNYGADWFFEKGITLVNARRSAEISLKETPLQYYLDLFPEGGNLVEGMNSKIAFRVTDQYGRGLAGAGFVTEDDQDTIARFRPYLFGTGSFTLTPHPGHHYRATFRLADGTAVSTLLPAAYGEGVIMRVSGEGNDHFRVQVQSSAPEAMFYLIAHTRQSVKVAEAIRLHEGNATLLIDKKSLGEGISSLTLFNAARQPVCERLVFTFPQHPLPIDVHSDQVSYTTRQPIHLQISTGGADCSVAVFRADSLQSVPAEHIGTYLWLTSDLRGKIESPEYYFDHPEDSTAMDNLLLTHGWRRFRWEEVLHHASPSFEFPPEYDGAIISGKILDARTGAAPGKAVRGYLSAPGTMTQFTAANCDVQGRVRFELRNFYQSQEVLAETDPSDSAYRIDIDDPFSAIYTPDLLPPFILPPGSASLLADRSVSVQVLNRYAGEKLKQFHFPPIDSSTFYYNPDYSYKLDDYTRFTTMEEVLREYVTMMRVEKEKGHFYLPLFDMGNVALFRDDPLILLDGVPVFNIDQLMTLDPLKIRKLEMIHRKFFLGETDFDGIMNWVSYKGDLAGYVPDARATVLDYEGLQLQREFYSPSYEEGRKEEEHLPDFRNVLYWEPEVALDTAGKGALHFYSSDLPGKYIVVVEGLTADGRTGSSLFSFEVTKPAP